MATVLLLVAAALGQPHVEDALRAGAAAAAARGRPYPRSAPTVSAETTATAGYHTATCALNQTAECPLPPWPATYTLSESSIMYQPWCINNGGQDCTGFINITEWWENPGRRDPGKRHSYHSSTVIHTSYIIYF